MHQKNLWIFLWSNLFWGGKILWSYKLDRDLDNIVFALVWQLDWYELAHSYMEYGFIFEVAALLEELISNHYMIVEAYPSLIHLIMTAGYGKFCPSF